MTAPSDPARRRFSPWRLLPLGLLFAGLAAFFAFGLDRHVSFQALRENQLLLSAWVAEHRLLAPVAFILTYAGAAALSLPVGVLLTITGGFLFGPWLGTLCVVIGATAGAVAVFLAARTALGESLRARAGPSLQRLRDGFRRDALSYLLFLRLVPLFPFWLVNIAPALLGVPLRTYILGTGIGIVPGTFVFAYVGRGLSSVFQSGEAFNAGTVLTADVAIALGLLGALSLVPIAYKRLRRR